MASVKIEIDSEALASLLTLKGEIEQYETQWKKANRAYKAAKQALGPARAKRKEVLETLKDKRDKFDGLVEGLTNDSLKTLLNAQKIRPHLEPDTRGKSEGAFNDGAAGLIRERFKGKSTVEFDIKARKEIATQAGCTETDVKATLEELADRGDGKKVGRFTKYKLKKA